MATEESSFAPLSAKVLAVFVVARDEKELTTPYQK
jgi:hypothetical protein